MATFIWRNLNLFLCPYEGLKQTTFAPNSLSRRGFLCPYEGLKQPLDEEGEELVPPFLCPYEGLKLKSVSSST